MKEYNLNEIIDVMIKRIDKKKSELKKLEKKMNRMVELFGKLPNELDGLKIEIRVYEDDKKKSIDKFIANNNDDQKKVKTKIPLADNNSAKDKHYNLGSQTHNDENLDDFLTEVGGMTG